MPTGVLPIKLGSSVNMPTKRFLALMDNAVSDCNRVRNAVVRKWQRWREDNPDWKPAQRRLRNGEPKVSKAGKPVMEHDMISQDIQNGLYHCYKEVSPNLSSNVASGCWAEVLSDLADSTPYNHVGAKYRWQAILNYEVQAPTYRGPVIPCAKKNAKIIFTEDRLEFSFPLLSMASGYRERSPIVRLKGHRSAGLSKGNQELLKRIVAGEVKWCDSKLVRKDHGWEFQLCYHVPIKDHGLDVDRVAILTPLRKDSRRPFELRMSDGARWTVGDGVPYFKECERVEIRRKAIRYRYRDGAGSGHGKANFYTAIRPSSRKVIDQQDRFIKHMVSDIIKFCIRNNCGTVRYREPTMPLRKLLWFDQQGCPFDWTRFAGHLAFKLEGNTIAQEFRHERKKSPVRIGVEGHKEEYPRSWPTK